MADLILKPGEIKKIYARTHKYGNVKIPIGAELIVAPKSTNWLILLISGDCDISGTLKYEKMRNKGSEIQYTAPDGRVLTHFPELGKGGRGGDGVDFRGLSGGAGAIGDILYGGGGGEGAYKTKFDGPNNGEPGNEWQGGGNPNGSGSGGKGAKLTGADIHGGAIYLSIEGTLSNNSENGTISLKGSDGTSGTQGRPGRSYTDYAYRVCGGGGGGGAPGGVGGKCVIKCSDILAEPIFEFEGGIRGNGSSGGGLGGSEGYNGEDGVTGSVDFM